MNKKVLIVLIIIIGLTLSPFLGVKTGSSIIAHNQPFDEQKPTLRPIKRDYSFLDTPPTRSSLTNGILGKILVDESKPARDSENYIAGPISLFGAYMEHVGYDVETNMYGQLNATFLANYDVVVLAFPQLPYTSQEISDIIDYVNSGGNVIFVPRYHKKPFYHTSVYLNDISEDFGITFYDEYANIEQIAIDSNHPVLYNVPLFIVKGGSRISADAGVSVFLEDSEGIPVMGNTTHGLGKVAFVNDDSLFNDVVGPQTNNRWQILTNLFNWITDNPLTNATIPDMLSAEVLDYDVPAEEMDKYNLYLGDFHVHCEEGSTDGGRSITDQLETFVYRFYDFMTLTDHSTDTPTKGFAPADSYYLSNELYRNFLWIPGFEMYLPHHTTFPTTQLMPNENDASLASMVEYYHSQGAVVFRAHPVVKGELTEEYFGILRNHTELGIDAFEVVDAGFFGEGNEGGPGEYSYELPFVGCSDAHGTGAIGRSKTYVFAENLTIPSIVDAVLHRRVVAFGDFQGYFYDQVELNTLIGDKPWLEALSAWKDKVETATPQVTALIDQLESDGWNSGKIAAAKVLLNKSQIAMREDYLSYGNAYRALENAIEELFDLEISVTNPTSLDNVGSNVTFQFLFKNGIGETLENVPVSITVTKASVLKDFNSEVLIEESGTTGATQKTIVLNTTVLASGQYRVKISAKLDTTFWNASVDAFIEFSVPVPETTTEQPVSGYEWITIVPLLVIVIFMRKKRRNT
ncbi:MAG: DUF2194 domain-containing protein [Candidatus Hodarchaeales archaeon]|jgi:hypothetical protein